LGAVDSAAVCDFALLRLRYFPAVVEPAAVCRHYTVALNRRDMPIRHRGYRLIEVVVFEP